MTLEGTTFYLPFEPVLMEFMQQCMNPFLITLASAITMLGEEYVMIAVLGFLYWCYDKEYGKFVGVNIITGIVLNPLIKNIALRRRPYFDHPRIACLKPVKASADIYDISAQGYSFPSGHSTNSVILYGSLPRWKKTRALVIIACAVPLLVGISRVLLGVHYPTDVLCGWLLGALTVTVISRLQEKLPEKLLYPLLFCVSCVGIFYCRTEDYFTGLGMMAGFFLAVPFERRYVRFKNTRSIPKSALRLAGGFAAYFALNTLLKLPFPASLRESATAAAFALRAVRYAVVTFAVMGVYPLLFDRFGKKQEGGS